MAGVRAPEPLRATVVTYFGMIAPIPAEVLAFALFDLGVDRPARLADLGLSVRLGTQVERASLRVSSITEAA